MCAKISKNAVGSMFMAHAFGPGAEFSSYYGHESQRDKDFAAGMLLGPAGIPVYGASEEEQRQMHTSQREQAEFDIEMDKLEAENRAAEEEATRRRARASYNPIKGAQRALAQSIGRLKSSSLLGSGAAGKKSMLGE